MQDPCYGGEGLEQSQIPHDNQDVSMSTMEEDQEAPYCGAVVSDESIVSNLPLLFVGGYPSSLETITLVSEIPNFFHVQFILHLYAMFIEDKIDCSSIIN